MKTKRTGETQNEILLLKRFFYLVLCAVGENDFNLVSFKCWIVNEC